MKNSCVSFSGPRNAYEFIIFAKSADYSNRKIEQDVPRVSPRSEAIFKFKSSRSFPCASSASVGRTKPTLGSLFSLEQLAFTFMVSKCYFDTLDIITTKTRKIDTNWRENRNDGPVLTPANFPTKRGSLLEKHLIARCL